MPLPPLSRRRLIAGGSALLAGAGIPAWAEIFQQGPAVDAVRAEAAEAALARAAALGASYADIRINRYRRESIVTRERQAIAVHGARAQAVGVHVHVDVRRHLSDSAKAERPRRTAARTFRGDLVAYCTDSPTQGAAVVGRVELLLEAQRRT